MPQDLSHALGNWFFIASTCWIYPIPWDICSSPREKTCETYPMPWDTCLSSSLHVRIIPCHGILNQTSNSKSNQQEARARRPRGIGTFSCNALIPSVLTRIMIDLSKNLHVDSYATDATDSDGEHGITQLLKMGRKRKSQTSIMNPRKMSSWHFWHNQSECLGIIILVGTANSLDRI